MPRGSFLIAGGLALSTVCVPHAVARAQTLGQETESAGAAQLRAAMIRIARNPDDPEALIDAGHAALLLGDPAAALSFFQRTLTVSPRNGRATAGLASAMVRSENPFEALKLFDQAIKFGVREADIAADRGLAFDLVGNFALAQRDYLLAGRSANPIEADLRRIISLGLSGDTAECERLLTPLLRRNLPSAWRARAFLLAAQGRTEDAFQIVRGFLPPRQADAMKPFLARMEDLTPAQQMAAIHFGHFPAGTDIGRDSREVRMAGADASRSPGSRLEPSGAPFGTESGARRGESRSARRRREQTEAAALAEKQRAAAETERELRRLAETAALRRRQDADARARVELERAGAMVMREPVATAQLPAGWNDPGPGQGAAQPTRALAPGYAPVSPAGVTPAIAPPVTGPPAAPLPANGAAIAAPPMVVTVADPAVAPAPSAAPQLVPGERPPPGRSADPSIASPGRSLVLAAPVVASAAPPADTPVPPAPGFDLALAVPGSPAAVMTRPEPPATATDVPAPQGLPAAETAAVRPPSGNEVPIATSTPVFAARGGLGAIVAAIEVPPEERRSDVVAVDLTRILPKAAKNAIKEPQKPAIAATAKDKAGKVGKKDTTPPQPVRVWYQLATGSSVPALNVDFARMKRANATLFGKRVGWTSPWGRTRRLVIGPFKDMGEAKAFDTAYRKAGGNGFVWQSAEGTLLEPLDGK